MATSLQQQQPEEEGIPLSNYYCHSCQTSFKSKEALCIHCKSEFVEEIEQPKEHEEQSSSTQLSASTPFFPSSRRRDRHEMSDEDTGDRPRRRRQGESSRIDLGETLGQYLIQLIQAREQLEDSENYTLPVIPPPPQFLDLMFRPPARVERSQTSSSSFAGALHTFVARLVEQLESSEGAPPAQQDKIDALATVEMTQEIIDKETECSICKEVYTLKDTARKMPCGHLFHDFCVVQWLKLRDTCPTCRYSLNEGKVMKS